jgi:transposase
MLKRRLHNVMTYFTRITNVASEGLNSRIETIKKTACGFQNLERFKIAILFHIGGLHLYPTTNGIA